MKNTSAWNKAGTRATPKTNARKNGWRGVVVIFLVLLVIGAYQGIRDERLIRTVSAHPEARPTAQPMAQPGAQPVTQPAAQPTAAPGAPFVPRNTSRDISADIQGRWLMLGDTDRHGKFTEYGGYVGDDLYSAEWRIDGDTVAFTQLANGVVRLQLKERYTIDDGMFYNHDSLFTGKAFIDGNQMAMEAADGQILYFRRVG